jgi:hypothetical protein
MAQTVRGGHNDWHTKADRLSATSEVTMTPAVVPARQTGRPWGDRGWGAGIECAMRPGATC